MVSPDSAGGKETVWSRKPYSTLLWKKDFLRSVCTMWLQARGLKRQKTRAQQRPLALRVRGWVRPEQIRNTRKPFRPCAGVRRRRHDPCVNIYGRTRSIRPCFICQMWSLNKDDVSVCPTDGADMPLSAVLVSRPPLLVASEFLTCPSDSSFLSKSSPLKKKLLLIHTCHVSPLWCRSN